MFGPNLLKPSRQELKSNRSADDQSLCSSAADKEGKNNKQTLSSLQVHLFELVISDVISRPVKVDITFTMMLYFYKASPRNYVHLQLKLFPSDVSSLK